MNNYKYGFTILFAYCKNCSFRLKTAERGAPTANLKEKLFSYAVERHNAADNDKICPFHELVIAFAPCAIEIPPAMAEST